MTAAMEPAAMSARMGVVMRMHASSLCSPADSWESRDFASPPRDRFARMVFTPRLSESAGASFRLPCTNLAYFILRQVLSAHGRTTPLPAGGGRGVWVCVERAVRRGED